MVMGDQEREGRSFLDDITRSMKKPFETWKKKSKKPTTQTITPTLNVKITTRDLNDKEKKKFDEQLMHQANFYMANNTLYPSEGLERFIQYITEARNLTVKGLRKGCLEVLLQCPTLESLEGLWKDYCSGHLNEVAERYLVTDDVKKELNLETVRLKTIITEENYLICKEALMENSYLKEEDASTSPASPTEQETLSGGLQLGRSIKFGEQETPSEYTLEQINFFRICYIAFDVVPQALRVIFKMEWDRRYKRRLGEWVNSPQNGRDFYNNESLSNRRKFPRQLAIMVNGNAEEWDSAMLYYAILYSDCLSHGISKPFRSAVEDLRMIRNEIAHMLHANVSDRRFSSFCDKVEAAFQSLGLSFLLIPNIRQQPGFPTEQTQFSEGNLFTDVSSEQLNYFRIRYIVTEVVTQGLRAIFKQEWDSRFKSTLGEWKDTPKNGNDFYHCERGNRGRHAYLLATMMNGNTEEWDCTMFFYAILYSDSVGSDLNPVVRFGVNDLRKVRNETLNVPQGRLSQAEFGDHVQKVQEAFERLKLSTAPIEDISGQRGFPTNVPEDVVEVGGKLQSFEKQLPSIEYEQHVSSFCSLLLKPPHDIIARDGDKAEIVHKLDNLKKTSENGLSCLIISGSPGSGKTQLAGQVANSFYNDVSKIPDAPAFVMLLNAESSESLLESYTSFAQQVKCPEHAAIKILEAEEIKSDEKITKLKDLIEQNLHLYTAWLLLVDNVTDVGETLKLLPEPGNERWKTGQMLITTRDTVSDLLVNSFTSCISIDKGMEPNGAISLLAAVSGTDDKEMLANVAKGLDFQPLALVSAARYVRQECESNKEPKRAWAEFFKKLGTGKESFTESVPTPEPSNLASTKVATRLAVEAMISTSNVIKHAFTFMSMCKRQVFNLDTLINYVQNVEQDQDKGQSESQIQACSLLLLGEEKNSISVGIHRVVLDVIRSVGLSDADSQLRAAVKTFKQNVIDPLEESWDKFEGVDSDRLIPFLVN